MKRWMKYVRPYLPYFIFGPLCMIVEVIGEVVMPRLMATVIDGANEGTLTAGSSIGIMLWMILTAVLMMLGGVGGAFFAAKASVNFAADLRSDLYGKVQGFSFFNIDRFSTGSLVTRLTNDVTQMQSIINMMMRMMLRAPGMMIAALIMALTISPRLSIVFAVSIPLLLVSVSLLIKTGFPRFGKVQEAVDGLNSAVQENVTNVRLVKSFVREDHETEKFRGASGRLKSSAISAYKIMVFMEPVMMIFMNATILAVILLGGRITLDPAGGLTVGQLSSFLTYVSQILFSLMMVTFMLMFSSRALASARRIAEVLDEKADITDDDAALPGQKVDNGSVEFKNVSFRYYKDSEEKVLDDINLTIPDGATVGIIGSTGAGKTTLVSMIPRLYDADEGEVLVGGINVKDYSLVNLRDGIGTVLQKNTLFSGSIADNLRWGDENASDEEMIKYADYAQADKFIKTFDKGYDTDIEQGGTNVSGGQKQRLCIARALLKKPKILILDDSTSAVDTATEAMIRKAFREELTDSTKIIIAQRIGSVMDADMIVVMNEGGITGIGTHEELLASNTEYREIYESQTGRQEKGA
ncbi:MAG: ABC transporter ATP-binding protein [Clostridia bacterium]|nr:ABC transporter ATP-binding protein [Clostridia bacterium]